MSTAIFMLTLNRCRHLNQEAVLAVAELRAVSVLRDQNQLDVRRLAGRHCADGQALYERKVGAEDGRCQRFCEAKLG